MQNEQLQKTEDNPTTAHIVSLHDLPAADVVGANLLDGNLSLISDVRVKVEVLVGSAELTVEELFAIKKGSILTLDQLHNAPLTVRLNGKIVARGELVVVEDNFGVRIAEILPVAKSTQA